MKKSANKQKAPIGFILLGTVPSVLLICVFMVYPMIQSALLSFQELGLLQTSGKFIGGENYTYLFTKDKEFFQALTNTLKLIFVVPIGTMIVSFALAIFLHRVKLREKDLYITFYFFPYFMSATVISIVWSFVFMPTSNGALNGLLAKIGLASLQRVWLGDTKTALWCIAVVIGWSCIGYHVVLYLSALDSISPEIYESARLDGASAWKQVIYITLPLMKNILGITFVLMMSGVLGVSFVYSKVMTNGGPNGSTRVLLHYIYQQGLERGNVGYASAVTVITMVLAIALAVLSRFLTRKSEVD